MAITFNPALSCNNYYSFGNKNKKENFGPIDRPLSSDEVFIKRTKKAISDSAIVVLGVCWLYFHAKKNMKINARINSEIKEYERTRNWKTK